ncbi:hypothetical protein [Prevotella intermedia]|uniref:Uncharacterized protein n=1 Tax=Prevotella intermedia TaxID=28131 RepID=A0A2M8MAG2_PREIN|nr:hypothetical protein [Prevotella intermedia]PJF01136.1 hypothetical protein CUB97_07785 [Prevotella intermedia]
MNENKERKDYLQPSISVFGINEEGHLLAGSPVVRPGGGGVPPNQGGIKVIDPTEEDGGDDDNLEG